MPHRGLDELGRLHERHRAWIAGTLDRARSFAAGDERRRQALGELRYVDVALVFAAARDLITGTEPTEALLGVQILDGVFLDYGDTDNGDQADQLVREGEQLLAHLCHSDQDPEILAAVLPPYTAVADHDPYPLLLELLDHPDPRVRHTAAQLIAAISPDWPTDAADADPTLRPI